LSGKVIGSLVDCHDDNDQCGLVGASANRDGSFLVDISLQVQHIKKF
jgi:hypothetical protein